MPVESYAKAPRQIVLDLDVTDTPLYGQQEDRFFHGYYNAYCYLPLYIFCGEHVLCARQRASNQDANAGCREEVERIVKQIRQRWPKVRIILRADSGFCRVELMAWCEQNRVAYVLGLARNSRLQRKTAPAMREAKQQHQRTGQAERVFADFPYRTRQSWSRSRRALANCGTAELGERLRMPGFQTQQAAKRPNVWAHLIRRNISFIAALPIEKQCFDHFLAVGITNSR